MLGHPKALPYCLLVVVLVCYLTPQAAQAQELGPFSSAGRLCAVLEYQGDGPTLPSFSDDRPLPPYLLCPGHQFRSPSGVYSALLQPDGDFVVARGDPTDPANIVWHTGKTGQALDFGAGLLRGSFIVYAFVPIGNRDLFILERFFSLTSETAQGNYFAKLSDEGTFTISAGTPSAPGKQIFSNNVDDPVESVDIESIAYDFEHVRSSPPDQRTGATQLCVNNIPGEFTCNLSLALSYTKTNTFTFSANQSIQLGYKSTAKVGLPGVGEASAEWSITGTVGFMEGRSDADSQARTFTSSGSVAVPPQTTYRASIIGTEVDATIPFTYTGTATYKSGKTAHLVDVQGEYNGVDTGEFTVQVTCVQTPGGCPPGFLKALPAVATQ
jgi:hypothetical protein